MESEVDGGYDNRLIREDRTFFCSELVAKALKCMGIIVNETKSCTQFFPKHFSSKHCDGDKCLDLAKGVTIDPDQEIIFNDDFLKLKEEINSGVTPNTNEA